MQEVLEMRVQSLGQKDPPEKEMATQFSILAWRIPWTAEPGGLQFMVSQKRHDWVTKQQQQIIINIFISQSSQGDWWT